MKHRNSHFAVGYWGRIRNGRPMPDQADIDPKALKRLLPFVFLLDARGGTFTYRLAGTTLCERYGAELRGRDYLSSWDPESRARLPDLLHQSLRAHIPVCLASIAAADDCHMVEIETALMPITFGSDQPERFLGVAQVLTDVGPLLGRIIAFERLVSSKLLREEVAAEPPSPPPPAGLREVWRAHPKAPHLRLVTSRMAASDAPKDSLSFDAGAMVRNLAAFVENLRQQRIDSGLS